MSDPDKDRLADVVATIHDRFGTGALYRLREAKNTATLSSGFAALDEALGGGLPHGRLVEIGGTPTAGVITLALKLVTAAQHRGYTTLYLDLGQTFDPAYAGRCGVLLDHFLLVHPRNRPQALALLRDLILSEIGNVIVLDFPVPLAGAGAHALSHTLDRLLAPLARANMLLLCLNPRLLAQAAPQAAVRLWLERERWLYHYHDVHGYQARIQILKNKGGPVGKEVSLSFTCASLPGMT